MLDIAICGCGPAGLASALLLHRSGHRVRIFERFERPAAVGSGLILQPTGLAVLREAGVLERMLRLGSPIERLFGIAMPSGRVALDVRYRALGAGWHGLGAHRAALFDTLFDAARADGIEILAATSVREFERVRGKGHIVSEDGRRNGPFDLVVDALGARSPLTQGPTKRRILSYGALWLNAAWPSSGPFQANALEQRYRGARQMVGVMPIGRRSESSPPEAAFFWSLKRADHEGWRGVPIDRWKEDVRALWPDACGLLEGLERHEQLTFAQYDHYTASTPFSEGLVQVGDAAHATSPQLGQGANMALLDALALSRALESGGDVATALPRYAAMRRWHVRLFQWASAAFTPFYQSDSRVLPLVRDYLASPLSRMPIGDRIIARLVSGMTVPPLAGSRFEPWAARARPGVAKARPRR